MSFRDRLEHSVTLLSGMAIGAGLMYVLDPNRGRARRAQASQRLIHFGRVLGRQTGRQGRNLAHQAYGSLAELVAQLRDRARTIPDDVLIERVRAQLGHVISHPGLLDIGASQGRVIVSGPVLEHEVERIRDRVHKTRGVLECQLRLEPHSAAELEHISGRRGRIPQREAV